MKNQVDFVLIVDELFDNSEQSLKAQIKLKAAFEKLNTYDIKVYLSYGNHDFTQGNLYPVEYPDNVYIYPDEQVTHFTHYQNDKPVANIYGFSYKTKVVNENKITKYSIINKHELDYH